MSGPVLDIEEFLRIRRGLRSLKDLNKFEYPKSTLSSILNQRIVEYVKRKYTYYLERLNELAEYWNKNRRIPRWLRLPPILRIRFLLKSLGYTSGLIRNALRNPDILDDQDLVDLVLDAILKDYVYSPVAIRFQTVKGYIGERIIMDWLESMSVEFSVEGMLRGTCKKTPDFYLMKPIWEDVKWMESKAMFGDIRIHSAYWRKQYYDYFKEFGRGIVVYWFGHIKGLVFASNGSFISEDFRNRIKMVAYVKKRELKAEKRKLIRILYEIAEKYKKGKRIVVGNNRDLINMLRGLGFEIRNI